MRAGFLKSSKNEIMLPRKQDDHLSLKHKFFSFQTSQRKKNTFFAYINYLFSIMSEEAQTNTCQETQVTVCWQLVTIVGQLHNGFLNF